MKRPVTASISELQENPMKVVQAGRGQPIAILSCGHAAFYLIPPERYERLIELAEDHESNAIADARLSDGQETVPVAPRDL